MLLSRQRISMVSRYFHLPRPVIRVMYNKLCQDQSQKLKRSQGISQEHYGYL
jgi:hypothetical protein